MPMENKAQIASTSTTTATTSTRRPRPWEGLTAEERQQVKEVFDAVDGDGSNALDWTELRAVLRAIGFPLSTREVKEMLKEADLDGNGFLSFDEFAAVIENLSRTEVDIRKEIMQGFKIFDAKSHGHIDVEDLQALCQNVEENIPLEDLRDMIREADSDGDGQVSLEDFARMMLKTNLYR